MTPTSKWKLREMIRFVTTAFKGIRFLKSYLQTNSYGIEEDYNPYSGGFASCVFFDKHVRPDASRKPEHVGK